MPRGKYEMRFKKPNINQNVITVIASFQDTVEGFARCVLFLMQAKSLRSYFGNGNENVTKQ